MRFLTPTKDMKNQAYEKWLVFKKNSLDICVYSNTLVQALRMVEDETKRYRPTKNYLEYFPTPAHTYEVS